MISVKMLLKDLFSNRISVGLVISHSIYVLIVFLLMPRQYGLTYHASEEPFYYKFLMTIDLPAIFVTGVLFQPAHVRGLLAEPFWLNLYYTILVAAATLQWLVVGHVLQLLCGRWVGLRNNSGIESTEL